MAAAISLPNLLTMAGGVVPGANIAYQFTDSKPGYSDASVGKAGARRVGAGVVTASAFTLPERKCGIIEIAPAKLKSTSPLINAMVAGPEPLYGMCVA